MYIVSYNVNGIRAAAAKGFPEWLKTESPDVVCVQESKAQPEQIPVDLLTAAGYHTYWFSALRKGYSGVGILSKTEPDRIITGMGMEKYDSEGRFIRADFGRLSIISVYHPNGGGSEERHWYKMGWLDDFLNYINELRKERPNLVISGDFNIAHKEIDIHDPVRNASVSGFLPEERAWMSGFIKAGFTDSLRHVSNAPDQYTWWSWRANARARNLGWRIDYNMVANSLVSSLEDAGIMPEIKHSDHCPAWVKLEV
ncbi:MAG: exodeoxyribonuclease III [Bacteroidia bacterium]|nr:MAG: exodeoxyribonuclease III [Bacteroidia bacterium]